MVNDSLLCDFLNVYMLSVCDPMIMIQLLDHVVQCLYIITMFTWVNSTPLLVATLE